MPAVLIHRIKVGPLDFHVNSMYIINCNLIKKDLLPGNWTL